MRCKISQWYNNNLYFVYTLYMINYNRAFLKIKKKKKKSYVVHKIKYYKWISSNSLVVMIFFYSAQWF